MLVVLQKYMNDPRLPKLLFIGGPDVSTRIELMCLLTAHYYVQMAGSNPDLSESFEKKGLEYHYYPQGQKANPFSYLLSMIKLLSIIHREHPAIVHTFDTKPSILGRLAAKMNRVPVVIGTITGLGSLYIIQGGLIPRLIRPIYEFLQKKICSISDLTIFYTQDDASFFLSKGLVDKGKMEIVPGSGILLDRFMKSKFPKESNTKNREMIGISGDQVVVTMIARLVRSKGILVFTELAKAVRELYPTVHFLLIGPLDNESLDCLTPEEIRYIRGFVHWIGNQSEVEKYLALSDIFVLPSGREGIPRVLMEAGAMGLPLVAFDSSGCREVIIDGKNGILVSPGNIYALEQAVVELIVNKEKRRDFGDQARYLVQHNFDIKKISAMLTDIYQDFLIRKGVVQ